MKDNLKKESQERKELLERKEKVIEMTNEQKLEYLSSLIIEAEENIEKKEDKKIIYLKGNLN